MGNEQHGGDGIDMLTCGGTSALHANVDGLNHLVSIGDLRVIVKNDGVRWSAQGLEIDYSVDGDSFEDVTSEFAHGLMLTIDDNIRVFGHIKNVLKTAPPEIWNEFFDGVMADKLELRHSQLSIHKIPKLSVYVAKKAA